MTGPLAQQFAQLWKVLEKHRRNEELLDGRDLDVAEHAANHAALSAIERHAQEDIEDWERIASEKGLAFLLDHLGLDGLANEVVARERHVQDMETAIARQLTPLDVAITHIGIIRSKGDDYAADERDNVAAIVEAHTREARDALFAALPAPGTRNPRNRVAREKGTE